MKSIGKTEKHIAKAQKKQKVHVHDDMITEKEPKSEKKAWGEHMTAKKEKIQRATDEHNSEVMAKEAKKAV